MLEPWVEYQPLIPVPTGWTIIDDLYLLNGTFYIVTDHPSSVPLLRLMTSTGNEIWNDEESINGRYVPSHNRLSADVGRQSVICYL